MNHVFLLASKGEMAPQLILPHEADRLFICLLITILRLHLPHPADMEVMYIASAEQVHCLNQIRRIFARVHGCNTEESNYAISDSIRHGNRWRKVFKI